MITGDENLQQIAALDVSIISIFEKQGLGSYLKPENLSKIGRFTKLNTLLKSKDIDVDSFVETLNSIENASKISEKSILKDQENLNFAAMLPCGLRNPFKEFTESFLESNGKLFRDLNYLIEGNVNHELSYYPLLDSIKDERELPDIIMASDVNNFFHRPFVDRFINKNVFKTYESTAPNQYLEKVGFSDPNKNFTMFTANMLVIAVDKNRLGERPIPEKWEDLLNPDFENEIVMRGEDNFFCNAVMLPFYKEFGMDAIKILAKNIKSGMHPAEMVKLAGKDQPESGTFYIMPYFFTKRIKNRNVEVVWPNDGAIASPVFLLAKESKIEENKKLLDFLLSKETGEMLNGRFFPSTHEEVKNENFPETVSWLGWDFLTQNDIGKLKENIREVFMEVWNKKD